MSNKEDLKNILEVCRKNGPMDESMVRGTMDSSQKKSEEYHAEAMYGINLLQFSDSGNEEKEK